MNCMGWLMGWANNNSYYMPMVLSKSNGVICLILIIAWMILYVKKTGRLINIRVIWKKNQFSALEEKLYITFLVFNADCHKSWTRHAVEITL